MQLAGQLAAGTPPKRSSAIGVLRAAVAAGVDHIGTAQYYGPGAVNGLIRDALYPYPDGLAIVSKVAARRDDSGVGHLRLGIEDSLRALRVAQLAAVNLRLPGDGRVDARFDDQLAAMVAARNDGLIAGIGLSNISLEQLRHAVVGTEIVYVQNLFHLADRTATPLLDLCLRRGIAFVPFCPLGWPRGQDNPVLTSPVVVQTGGITFHACPGSRLDPWGLVAGEGFGLACDGFSDSSGPAGLALRWNAEFIRAFPAGCGNPSRGWRARPGWMRQSIAGMATGRPPAGAGW